MSLKTNKSVTLQGNVEINGSTVVYLYAQITTENTGNTTVNQNIQNQDMYTVNKKQIRADIAEFTNKVYEIEDQLMSEDAEEKTSEN